jgi:mRNA interferase RelE/StbE
MYTISLSKKAAKSFDKLPVAIRERIDFKIKNYLALTPRGHDSVKLAGQSNIYRTRVGDYRIVYEIIDQDLIVWIVDIDGRGSVYKKL